MDTARVIPTGTILDEIADYAHYEAKRRLPAEVVHHAKRAIVDWFASLYPGTRVSPATNLVRAHFRELGHGRSSLPGFKTTAFPSTAAWINGSASHAVEFDDIFRDAVYHPGAPTIAAALAVAEDEGRSGRDLITAVTIGYEISTRIGAAVQPSHYRFFHTTGTVGCFGSAAAVATLMNPGDRDVMGHALATAATFASGLQQALRSDAMSKALHAGHAAAVGVAAGTGAASGITGALDILEGETGFGAALSDGADWSRATAGLGEHYNITRITQKTHACCGHVFAPIDAVLSLRREHPTLNPATVRSILVETYQAAIDVAGNSDPKSPYQAKFSLPYAVCYALFHDSVRLDAFTNPRLAEERIRTLMRRVTLKNDPELTARFPSMRAARVTLTTEDGRTFQHCAPHRKGDPEAPLSDAELNGKFDELVTPVIGHSQATRLREQLWHLDRLELSELQLVPHRV
jgi:2-methylcitrate dehydratase PrpD